MRFDRKPDERFEIRLSGTGGQGIITAGMILGEACAFYAGLNVCMTQSYGPEARGGACRAELVFSDEEIDAPKPEKVDLLLAMSQQAYDKYKDAVKEWGILIVDSSIVKYDSAKNLFPLPFTTIAREKVGFAVTANIVAVGFIAALTGLADYEAMKKVVARKVPPGTEKTNYKALRLGFEAAAEPVSTAGIPIDDYISTDVLTVDPDVNIRDAVRKMLDAGTEMVLVTEGGKLEGVFTFFDTIKALARGKKPARTPVRKFMSRNVVTCTRDSTLGQVLILMEENRYKNIPVVDENGHLVGMVSYYNVQDREDRDITLKESVDFINATRTLLTGDRWSALKSIASSVPRVSPDTPVSEIAAKMSLRRADSVIVVDEEDRPIGILTERDINRRVVARGLDPEKTPASKVMTKRLVTISNRATITEAFERMVKGGFHHLPLVNSKGKLRGAVSLADIAHIIHSRYYLYETIGEDQVPPYED